MMWQLLFVMVTSGAPGKDAWDGAGLEAESLSVYLLTKQLLRECSFNQKRKENVGGSGERVIFPAVKRVLVSQLRSRNNTNAHLMGC